MATKSRKGAWRNVAAERPWCTFVTFFRAKKDTQTQRFHPKTPCLDPPFLEAFNPRNSLCSGCVSLRNIGKTRTQRFLKGGGGGQKKNLCVRFLWVFFPLFIFVCSGAGGKGAGVRASDLTEESTGASRARGSDLYWFVSVLWVEGKFRRVWSSQIILLSLNLGNYQT